MRFALYANCRIPLHACAPARITRRSKLKPISPRRMLGQPQRTAGRAFKPLRRSKCQKPHLRSRIWGRKSPTRPSGRPSPRLSRSARVKHVFEGHLFMGGNMTFSWVRVGNSVAFFVVTNVVVAGTKSRGGFGSGQRPKPELARKSHLIAARGRSAPGT
jgi:hypothetical protein